MKKNVLMFCMVLVGLSLTAFGYINLNSKSNCQKEPSCQMVSYLENTFIEKPDPILFFNVDHRFATTISKMDLHGAETIIDILPKRATELVVEFQEVKLTVIHEEGERSAKGFSATLNEDQLALLQSANYSKNFYVTANYKGRNSDTGEVEDDYLVWYMTVVPETEAEFIDGHDALMSYIKENIAEEAFFIQKDKLKPGKLSFTVSKDGAIKNAKLTSTSGYVSLDERMLELINTIPGKWKPAANSAGEIIEQELVLSFGIEGC